MIKRICVLTKSYKHGGYCVAGIDIDSKQWVRLVNSEDPNNDEIKKEQMVLNGNSIECLDVIEFDFIKNIQCSCQTENWLLNKEYKPRFIKSISLKELIDLLTINEEDNFILNYSNVLNGTEIEKVNHSLFVYCVSKLKIEVSSYDYFDKIKFKCKCSFEYNNNTYHNISLTDPIYRDLSQNGNCLDNALIIASLPCIPFDNNLYYKFVAKIIPIDKQTACYIKKLKEGNKKENEVKNSSFRSFDLVIRTIQTPGIVLFENYDQIKQRISEGVSYYNQFEYTLENYQLALKHQKELKFVKNTLEKTKREIIKSYDSPLEIVTKKLEELIDLVKIPFKKVDTFIKQNEKDAKKYEIYKFSKNVGILIGLQEHLNNVLKSPAFFDSRWLNLSCTKSSWQSAVSSKLNVIAKDIKQILSMKNENLAGILANYYQTLSMKGVEDYLNSLKVTTDIAQKTNVDNADVLNLGTQNSQTDLNLEIKENTVKKEFKDFDVLKYVAKSVNPYTSEYITGIDDKLKAKLNEIAFKLENFYRIENNLNRIEGNIKNPTKRMYGNTKTQSDKTQYMAWKRWTEQEDQKLISEFKQGLSISEIAKIHHRKTGGIRARLKKHKLID